MYVYLYVIVCRQLEGMTLDGGESLRHEVESLVAKINVCVCVSHKCVLDDHLVVV